MIEKELRNKILNMYIKKEERVFAGHIIDLINKFENNNYVVHTHFLDLNELNISKIILNKLKVRYYILNIIEDIQRTVIFLVPDYILDENILDIYKEYITCIKITPNVKNKIGHSNYMGAIYSLGIDKNMIGDIFVCKDNCYVFTFKNYLDYLENNLLYVGKVEVKITNLDLESDEVKSIRLNYKRIEVMVPSLRIDVILAEVYNLSRNETKNKIESGDLFINSKEMFFVANNVSKDDIVSLKKCGKLKIGDTIRMSKSGKIVLEIFKYI